MDGSSAANSVIQGARLLAALLLVLCVAARAQAEVRVRNCPVDLTTSFYALLELELPASELTEVDVTLTCEQGRALLRAAADRRELTRSISLQTTDAGRWLALATAELVGRLRERAPPAAPEVQAPAPARSHPYSLRLAARARWGDEPRTLRLGGELGLGVAFKARWWLDGTLRLTTGQEEVYGPIRVRASDGSYALTGGYLFSRGRLQLLPGLGAIAGATRLSADAKSSQLDLRSLTRGFVGPVALVRTRWQWHARLSLELTLEAAYLTPRIEGRDETRRVLFTQTTWYAATSVGLVLAL